MELYPNNLHKSSSCQTATSVISINTTTLILPLTASIPNNLGKLAPEGKVILGFIAAKYLGGGSGGNLTLEKVLQPRRSSRYPTNSVKALSAVNDLIFWYWLAKVVLENGHLTRVVQ